MPRRACPGASNNLLRFLGGAVGAARGASPVAGGASGVALPFAESGVAVSLPGSGLTEGDFSIDGMGVAGLGAAAEADVVAVGVGS